MGGPTRSMAGGWVQLAGSEIAGGGFMGPLKFGPESSADDADAPARPLTDPRLVQSKTPSPTSGVSCRLGWTWQMQLDCPGPKVWFWLVN
ncbi:uncharacterized protein UV8b_01485 [Ustilaginoidea virens]|nr:uncharacterized protein UV8b_01485 [Ustilaginoidea virens]QUC17244.1 hypothetical protein UV8b_01485 [Ustilaginoidea virens]